MYQSLNTIELIIPSCFAQKQNHINGIENFWNQAKRHMRKFNGIPGQHFNLFLKECEWRFNIGAPSKLLVDLKSLLKESLEFEH